MVKVGGFQFFHMAKCWNALIQTKFHFSGRDQAKKIPPQKEKAQLN